MQKSLLGHVLGLGDVAQHPQAECIHATLVQGIQLGKRIGVAVLRRFDGLGLAGYGRVALKEAGIGFCGCYGWFAGIHELYSMSLESSSAHFCTNEKLERNRRPVMHSVRWEADGKGKVARVSLSAFRSR
jgi:hypothetical protein